MKINFNVRNESVGEFLTKTLLTITEKEKEIYKATQNAYSVMRDEILIKNNGKISEGEKVQIELFDRSEHSRKELRNIYIYEAEKYDDVSLKLRLVLFKIEQRQQKKEY